MAIVAVVLSAVVGVAVGVALTASMVSENLHQDFWSENEGIDFFAISMVFLSLSIAVWAVSTIRLTITFLGTAWGLRLIRHTDA